MSRSDPDPGRLTPVPDPVEDLRDELEALRDRVAELEAQVGPGGSSLPAVASDYRDARVLEAIDVGDEVHLRDLRALFLDRTDIRDDGTLRDRIKDLVESEAFDNVGTQRWEYLGPGGDHS